LLPNRHFQPPKMTTASIAQSFPITTITPIANILHRPSYASLRIAQTELNSNAASVHSNLGGGEHGHLVLTIPTAEYLILTEDTPFNIPENPPAQPIHPAGATISVITEANRQHLEAKQIFKTYHAVDQALRKQVLAAVPDVYTRALKHATTGYGNITSLQLLTHLWTNYGTITQLELDENQLRMQRPWNPPTPVEALFNQLTEGIAFAAAGDEALSNTQVIRIGYNLISKTGLFELPCHEWRQKSAATKTMNAFQTHFRDADQDRLSTATTATAGYHNSANLIENSPTPAAPTTMTNDELINAAVQKQVAIALAAMQVTPAPAAAPRNTGQRSYCWTHGGTRNLRHTSQTCRYPATGHQTTATVTDKMGGSTKEQGNP
jgi:hypothetical protein